MPVECCTIVFFTAADLQSYLDRPSALTSCYPAVITSSGPVQLHRNPLLTWRLTALMETLRPCTYSDSSLISAQCRSTMIAMFGLAGETALFYTVCSNNHDEFQFLIDRGASWIARDEYATGYPGAAPPGSCLSLAERLHSHTRPRRALHVPE